MRNKFMIPLLITVFVMLALPALASTATTVTFDDASDKTIGTAQYTFKGTITTPEMPETLQYYFKVRRPEASTLIDHSMTNRNVTFSQTSWNNANGQYSNQFAFTANFGSNTGTMLVYLEVWKTDVLLASQVVRVNVAPIQLTITQQSNLSINQRNFEFTGTIQAYSNSPGLSYKVLDGNGNIIDQSSTSKPVVLTSWTYDPGTKLYSGNLKFTADFGSYTGAAQVVLQASDGTATATKAINVSVTGAPTTPVTPVAPVQISEFNNRGQLVSYLASQLKIRGYGNHKNKGQALKYCLRHPRISQVKTPAQADQFLTEKVLAVTTTARKKSP